MRCVVLVSLADGCRYYYYYYIIIIIIFFFFFFKQKTAYEIGTGDWSSDVCSSDLMVLKPGGIIFDS